MKKVLFLSLILAVGMTGFAQKDLRVKNDKSNFVKVSNKTMAFGKEAATEAAQFTPNAGVPATAHYGTRYDARADFETMTTQMDLGANGFVANRMWRFDDGSVGLVGQFPDNSANRGTGYNFYDGSEFGDQPEARIEGMRTGWPVYCQYGTNGEIVVAHTGNDLVYYTRATKGEGEWVGPKYIPNPDLGYPAEVMTWPKVVTSGPNHDIIHVIAADQADDFVSYDYYARSTDGENWTVTTIPTLQDGENFSADTYSLAANGNVVAMSFSGSAQENAYIIKSTDNGETWTQIKVWDNPYAGLDWENDEASVFGDDQRMFGPDNASICIDNNGMVHAAYSSMMFYHPELGDTWYVGGGLTMDGIFYWNETMGTVVGPGWTCPDDGFVIEPSKRNAFRFWFPTDESGEYVRRNFNQNVIGFVDLGLIQQAGEFNNDLVHDEQDYRGFWLGMSCSPAICVDADGTIAIAFSMVDPSRIDASTNKYYRSVVVSYLEAPYIAGDAFYYQYDNPEEESYTDHPGNYFYNMEYLQDVEDEEWGFFHSMDEAIFVNGITNTVDHEFWFAFQADQMVGLNVGNGATQTAASDGIIWAVKLVPDSDLLLNTEEHVAVNPMTTTRVYPNPATSVLNIEVNASQSSDMNIAVFNITGQKVMEKNVNLHAGINTPSISTTDLSSGIYFVTVKANGFENTMKFIVK